MYSDPFVLFKVRQSHLVPVRGDSWAASGKDNPKLISDRGNGKLSDQVTDMEKKHTHV